MSVDQTMDWGSDPRLLAYVMGELPEAERESIDAALANGDTALAAELENLRAFLPKLELALQPAESADLVLSDRARATIKGAAAEMNDARRLRFTTLPVAFAAAVLFVLGIGVLQLRSQQAESDQSAYIVGDSGGTFWLPSAAVDSPIVVGYGGKMIIPKSPRAHGMYRSLGYLGNDASLGSSEVGVPSFVDNPFVLTSQDRLATFSIDVDTASYSLVRSMIESGRIPSPGNVRAEEFINYFSYGDAAPSAGDEHPMAVTTEVAAAPWAPEHRLVRIGLAAERIEFEERPPANLVFLVDVSGSMSGPNKLPLVVKALSLLTESLAPDDRIAIVVYAQAEGLVLDSTPIAARESILQALESLDAGGTTNGGAGIELAYRVAGEHFVQDGVNRVILCTDGDFNVGTRSDRALEELIAEKAANGVDLSVLGFGGGVYRDDKMEKLSNRGNGNFAFIDSMQEARKVLTQEVAGTLVTVARDTKIQVEWNVDLVQSFRQIGYENRWLAHEDFANDAVDAGEMGAGHVVTALFEVVPQPGALLAGFEGVGEVRVRYKRPASDTSELLKVSILDGGASFGEASDALRFSAAAAAFAMVLRANQYVGATTLGDVRRWAIDALGTDPGGLRAAFVELVERARKLQER